MLYHVSHNDLDGVGCQIITAHTSMDVTFYNVNNNEVDNTIVEILNEMGPEDQLLITDLSPTDPELISRLDLMQDRVSLIDHHKTALERLGDREWAFINMEYSATTLTLDIYQEYIPDDDIVELLDDFAQLVDDYDLWKLQYPESQRLNTLLDILGLEKFRARFIVNPAFVETIEEEAQIDLMVKMKQDYVDKAVKYARIKVDKEGHAYAELFAEENTNLIADRILKENKLVRYVKINNAQRGTVSLRSRPGEFDVSRLAKERGGGGHQPAAGYSREFVEKETPLIGSINLDPGY